MKNPGQRVQIDVKHVSAVCIIGNAEDEKFYNYIALDEFTRFRYIETFPESLHIPQRFFKTYVESISVACGMCTNRQWI